MVKIRLRKTGCNRVATFRVVACDSRSPRDGKFLEILGWYDPRKTENKFDINLERIAYWKSQGAQISATVTSIVKQANLAAPAEQAQA
ncbi:MAG: 30S ribosomal protein S16 [Kiritimatiellia bacterium]